MTRMPHDTASTSADLVYLVDSDLELADPADDVRGLVVLTPQGLRLGEVGDLVVDRPERRARLLSVLSGGILGLGATERLVPVEAIIRVDDRVHVDRSHVDDAYRGRGGRAVRQAPGVGTSGDDDAPFAEVYERYDVVPFWSPAYVQPAFLRH